MRPVYYLSALGLSGALLGTLPATAQIYSVTDLEYHHKPSSAEHRASTNRAR